MAGVKVTYGLYQRYDPIVRVGSQSSVGSMVLKNFREISIVSKAAYAGTYDIESVLKISVALVGSNKGSRHFVLVYS